MSTAVPVPRTPKDLAKYFAAEYHISVIVLNNPETGTKKQLESRKKAAIEWTKFQTEIADGDQIDKWFSHDPNYSFGLVMGPDQGLSASTSTEQELNGSKVKRSRCEPNCEV